MLVSRPYRGVPIYRTARAYFGVGAGYVVSGLRRVDVMRQIDAKLGGKLWLN